MYQYISYLRVNNKYLSVTAGICDIDRFLFQAVCRDECTEKNESNIWYVAFSLTMCHGRNQEV